MINEETLPILDSYAFTNIDENLLQEINIKNEDIFVYRYNLYAYLYSLGLPPEVFPFVEIYNRISNNEFNKPMTLKVPTYEFINIILSNTDRFVNEIKNKN